MPPNMLQSLADKAGVSLATAEKAWSKAKAIALKIIKNRTINSILL